MYATDTSEFSGKRVLVTGGTKGTGKAIAERFLRGRATVAITARSAPTEKASAHYIQADVSTSEGTSKVIHEILDRFKGVDIIVHNVGGSSAPSGGFMTVTDEFWQQAINENLYPAVRLDRGLLPSMIERGSASSCMFRPSSGPCLSMTRRSHMQRPKRPSPTTARLLPMKLARRGFGS